MEPFKAPSIYVKISYFYGWIKKHEKQFTTESDESDSSDDSSDEYVSVHLQGPC